MILSYLKLRIDRDRRRYGRWILTGSQRFQLMADVLVCRVRAARPLPGGNVALPWREFPRWLDGRVG